MMSLPPGQQIAAASKWPIVGERLPAEDFNMGPWTVAVGGEVALRESWTLAALTALPQARRSIDIHCVTRWSKLGMIFEGVRLAELIERSQPTESARFVSFVAQSARRHSSSLPLAEAIEIDALLAVSCDGEPLAVEHGGPVRVVVPGRYFYKSVKWVRQIDLLAEDRLGYWESEAGYHNRADPWREQRYIAPGVTRHEMQSALASRDFSGRELRSIEAGGRELIGLKAVAAVLRDARFEQCDLRKADFSRANLSNASFRGADLRGAKFVRADVEGADLTGADLRGADLRGASLLGATFCDAPEAAAENATAGAIIDATTRFDGASLDDLTPTQAAFVLSVC
jgi:DMSO/TMAO reductase YedYZ molybdopterin-dependent catalytic subunit